MRRNFILKPTETLSYNLTDFLGENFKPVLPEEYSLQIYDDRDFNNVNDMEKMIMVINSIFPNYHTIKIYNLKTSSYRKLIDLKKDNKLKLKISQLTLDNYDVEIFPEIIPVWIDNQDVSNIPLYNSDNVIITTILGNSSVRNDYFDNKILSNKEFIYYITYLAEQISKYATNDIQKILLTAKIFKENISFDWYFTGDEELLKSLNKQAKELGFKRYISHAPQSILLKRNAVCSSIALFASILLRHPKLNIDIEELTGRAYGEPHCFNKVRLNNKKYTCDFTHNITRGFDDPIKYILVKQPSETHTIDDGDFEEYETIDREYLMSEYEKIKDIHIQMPVFEEASFNIKYADESLINKTKK